MAHYEITCPTTGKPVNTTMGGDRQSLERNRAGYMGNSINCPHCGKVHTWNGTNAQIVDDEGD